MGRLARSRPAAVTASGRQGVLLGLVYGAAQLLQTAGLEHTAASVSGFITGMYAVFTPLLAAAIFRQHVGRTGRDAAETHLVTRASGSQDARPITWTPRVPSRAWSS